VLAAVGEIDLATAPLLSEALSQAPQLEWATGVVLDFTATTFLGSPGLAVLADVWRAG
jgi:anti-anti-sigma factor